MCSAQGQRTRFTCGTVHQSSPTPSAVLWVQLPSGGGDRYLHHLVWSEELMFRCQWVCWVSSGLLLFP